MGQTDGNTWKILSFVSILKIISDYYVTLCRKAEDDRKEGISLNNFPQSAQMLPKQPWSQDLGAVILHINEEHMHANRYWI